MLALRWGLSANADYEAKMTKRPSRGDIQSDESGNNGAGTTGQDLREQREALGEQLGDIAETLCIRLDFLKALEAGDYDSLPGSAYAVGFVRSYARHLGMDGDKLAWQFKVEVSGETPTAKLDFLTPLQESRIPRGAIVLVTVLLAVTIYGVWYYMNARDLTFADIIPDVPLQFGRHECP
jgi:cytoskeletal protein RodZ